MRLKAPSASARSLCVEYWTSWIYNPVSSFVIRAKLHNNGTQTITTCQGWDHCFENVCAAIGTVLNGGVTCAFSIKILIENHFQQSNNDVSSISPFFWRGVGKLELHLWWHSCRIWSPPPSSDARSPNFPDSNPFVTRWRDGEEKVRFLLFRTWSVNVPRKFQ